MPRIARFVAEGIPHHITHRGNARQAIFGDSGDRQVYLKLLREYASQQGVAIWAWCLMTNHVHFLAVPSDRLSFARAIGRAHRDYAQYHNTRYGKCGHLWQQRFYSCPVDEPLIWTVMAYIERNPVRAGIVEFAEDYPWSSAVAHLGEPDTSGLLNVTHWRETYTLERWREVLSRGVDEEALSERIRCATLSGRPFGSEHFVESLELASHRRLRAGRPGRPKKTGDCHQISGFRTI